MRVDGLPGKPPTKTCRVVIDSREQLEYDFGGQFTTERGTLPTGDYALAGEFSQLVCVERKTLADFVSSCSTGRERFDREINRMAAYKTRAVVVEASFAEVQAGVWSASANSLAIQNSITSFFDRGVPVFLAGDRAGGERFTASLLWRCWIHEYRKLRAIAGELQTQRAAP